MANDCIPYYRSGEDLPCQAGGAITGKRFVKISANRQSGPGLSNTAEGSNYVVVQATAGVRALGVAMYDAPSGGKVGVMREGVVPVAAGASITAGVEVECDATGRAIPLNTGKALGMALNGQTTVDADAEILLYT